jgi:hypothetical protein
MVNDSLKITIDFTPIESDLDKLEELTQILFKQMREFDEIERVERLREIPPPNVKGLGMLKEGLIALFASPTALKPLLELLGARVPQSPKGEISLEIESEAATGKQSVKFKCSNLGQQEILQLMEKIEMLVQPMKCQSVTHG